MLIKTGWSEIQIRNLIYFIMTSTSGLVSKKYILININTGLKVGFDEWDKYRKDNQHLIKGTRVDICPQID